MTNWNIERDLHKTPFYVCRKYENGNEIIFYFSSERGMNKFLEKSIIYHREVMESLTNRFNFLFIISPDFTDLVLYRKCETRSYLIKLNGVECSWQGKLKFCGQKVEVKS